MNYKYEFSGVFTLELAPDADLAIFYTCKGEVEQGQMGSPDRNQPPYATIDIAPKGPAMLCGHQLGSKVSEVLFTIYHKDILEHAEALRAAGC